MSENVVSIFMIIAALAIIIQAGILTALFFTVKKTTARVEEMANRAIPLMDSARTMLDDSAPKLREITANLVDVSGNLKHQSDRLDATVGDLLDRTRLQVIRVDQLVGRTLDRVEETTELVQATVVSPIKQISGIVQGLSVGIGSFLGSRRRSRDGQLVVEDEELFI